MAYPTVRSKTTGARYLPEPKRYRIPGGPPPSIQGLDAGSGSGGSSGLIGGVGLKGLPSSRSKGSMSFADLPTLPQASLSSIDPGLYEVPTYDLVKIDAMRGAARAEAPRQKIESLKAFKDVAPMALGSPGLAEEIGAAAADVGLPELGGVISRMRPGYLPGGAPDVPGAPPEIPGVTRDFAQALAQVVAQMRQERPYEPVSALTKEALGGLMHAAQQAQVESAKLEAEYAVKMQREPALVRAKDLAGLPGAQAREDIQTAGARQREVNKYDLLERRGIGLETRLATETQRARESEMTTGARQRGETKLQQQLQMEPQIAAAVEKAKTPELMDRKRQEQELAGRKLESELKIKLQDFRQKLAARTDEAVRKRRLLGGKGDTKGGVQELALKEAFKFVQSADLSKADDKPAAAGDLLGKVYAQFLKAANESKMDPTARAVMDALSR